MVAEQAAVEIEVLLKQGLGVREVARRCGVSRNTVRPVRAVEPLVRFETPPGRQMQVDWAEFRLDGLRWFAFVVVLGFTRWIFGRFVGDQRFETLRDLHVAALEPLGGRNNADPRRNTTLPAPDRYCFASACHGIQARLV